MFCVATFPDESVAVTVAEIAPVAVDTDARLKIFYDLFLSGYH